MTNSNIVKRWMEGGKEASSPAFGYDGGEVLRMSRGDIIAVKFNGFYCIDPSDLFVPMSNARSCLHVWPEKSVNLPMDLLSLIIGNLDRNGNNFGGLTLLDQYNVNWGSFENQVFESGTYSLLENYGNYFLTGQSSERKGGFRRGRSVWLTKLVTRTPVGERVFFDARTALYTLVPKECLDYVGNCFAEEQSKFYEYEVPNSIYHPNRVWKHESIIGFKRGVCRQGDLYFVPVRWVINVSTKIPCNDSDVFLKYLECWPKCQDSVGTHFRVTQQYIDGANSMEYISNRVHNKTGSDQGRGRSRHTFTDIGMVIRNLYQWPAPTPLLNRGTLVVRGIVRHPQHDNLKLEVVDREHLELGGWFTVHPVENEEWSRSQNLSNGRPRGD